MNAKLDTRLKRSAAKLYPLWDDINNSIFEGHADPDDFYLHGPTVRNSLAGSLSDEIHIVMNSAHAGFKSALLNWLISNQLNKKLTPLDQINENTQSFLFKSKFGDKVLYFSIYESRPDWNCDGVKFSKKYAHQSQYGWSFLQAGEIATTTNLALDNYEKILQSGAAIIQQTGWKISFETLQKINSLVEFNKPLEIKDKIVLGFRAYRINMGYLVGFHGVRWESELLKADCPNLEMHFKNSLSTSGGQSQLRDYSQPDHGCGIYIYKSINETVHFYGADGHANACAIVVGGGAIWEGERGYRVEEARIEKLYVWRGSPQLKPGIYNPPGGILVDVTRDDFMREVFRSGIEFDSSSSLV